MSNIWKRCKLYIKKSSKSQPEDGFRKKAETCSCRDVLISFNHIFYGIKVVLDNQVIHSVSVCLSTQSLHDDTSQKSVQYRSRCRFLLQCSTILCRKRDLISFTILYTEIFLPRISCIVVLPEDGHVGRNMLQSTINLYKNLKNWCGYGLLFYTLSGRGVIDGYCWHFWGLGYFKEMDYTWRERL